jgi:hypothetical protein
MANKFILDSMIDLEKKRKAMMNGSGNYPTNVGVLGADDVDKSLVNYINDEIAAGRINASGGGSGSLTDGDYGNVVVSENGSNMFVKSVSGYSHSSAFAARPSVNGYQWSTDENPAFENGVSYTADDVANEIWKVFSLSNAAHLALDNPYWTTPTPTGTTGIGLFEGENLPDDITTLFDYTYDYDTENPGSSGTGFEGSVGRIKLNDLQYGDQVRVRFEYNIIPQIANTTVEPALWYANRDESDNITYTFPLTTSPSFYGAGTVGKSYLNRIEISAWITSSEDVNALTLPAIKSDNPVIIQPVGMLVTIIR